MSDHTKSDEKDQPACKHCGRPLGPNGTHAEGRQRGLGRCDTADSSLPYGYEAERIGQPCSIACLGSVKPDPREAQR